MSLHSLLAKALATEAKSSALRPLGWLVGLSITGALIASRDPHSQWLAIAFAWMTGGAVLVYLGGFVFFALKNPDCLRTERYSLQKMEIQSRLVGDSGTGLSKMTDNSRPFIELGDGSQKKSDNSGPVIELGDGSQKK